MKKLFIKSLAVILVVVMMLTAAPLSGFIGLELPSLFDFKTNAAEISGGTCGDNLTWSLSETGVLQISGTGPMNYYHSYDAPWRLCGYQIKSVYITDGVTYISGFEYLPNLTTAIIGNSVTSIATSAFGACYKLTNVTIGNSVTTIGGWAFADTSITNISIPNSVMSIGNCAFGNCDLTTVSIPENVITIGDYAFTNCDNLTSVSIPSSVISIGANAFAGCSALTNVTFANDSQLPTIGDYAFCSCGITSFSVPDSVTSIGNEAFRQCTNLEYVHIPASVTSIGDGAFATYNFPGRIDGYICSTTRDCYAREYALKNLIKFKVCDGHETDKPTDDNKDKPYKIYGRDFEHNLDYFAENGNSSKYDPELANILAALSAAAYDEDSIKQAYEKLGFDDCETFNYDGFTLGKVAYSLAFKKSDNSDETICLVTVRGTVNTSEWLGNANISTTNGKHNGFLNATNQIYDNIQNHIDSNNITGDVKYFVTGHSRGAAVGNLLSVGLMENGVASSDVYNYNYACPDVATKAVFPDYYNIFNVCNTADVVPFVPGNIGSATESESHWGKYGRTHWFTVDIPDTGDTVKDVINDHNYNLYLGYMDKQLDTSEFHREPTNNAVIGHNAKIQCPVDVVITNKNGKTIASVINGEINYYDSAFGDVIILTDGDKKFIYINGDKDFNVNLVGTDNGEMTYSIEKYNIFTEETLESKTFENVKLEKGKEMQSSVCGDKTADDVSLYVYENNNGKKTVKYVVNTDGSEIEISEAFKDFAIKQPSVTTVKYGDTLVLNADIVGYTLPAGYTVEWFVEGAGVSTSVSEDGSECRVTSIASGNATIYAKLVDADGNVVTDVEGEEILDEITIASKAGFWQKFISFFKNLFRINRIIY